MRAILLLTTLTIWTTLVGCATGPSRPEVLASLVGRSEADAIRVLGAPNRILQANGSRFLAYDERAVGYAPAPGFGPFGPYGYGYGYGYFIAPTMAYERTCETTVEILGGQVRSFNLRGNGC